jgi:hypothetical protein
LKKNIKLQVVHLNNHPQLDTNRHHTQQKFIKPYK